METVVDNSVAKDDGRQRKWGGKIPACVSVCTVALLLSVYCGWSYCFYGDLYSGWLFLNGIHLKIIDKEIDLGTMNTGETRDASFRLQNVSGASVIVLGVHTCCDCLKVSSLPMKVMPYQSVIVPVTFSPKPSQTGVVEQFVLLNLNVEQPQESLTIKAVVNSKP
ncbi:hypothetical protein FACS189419_07670 [Planctomycetales bacterium]|nr:hypothetical protein FACS189419_07670 [Planctomycetales bacterium]